MYQAADNRYDQMIYHRLGDSGLKLPAISLGMWHNFGGVDVFEKNREVLHYAFDHGITHFDLANNYGPPAGSAEELMGKMMLDDFKPYRDEMVISSKAGYHMWEGPYGEWGSKKNIIASANQSLQRLNLDYVDIFYTHRPDPETRVEETALALDQLIHQGKALYIGISNYSNEQTQEILAIFKELKTPFIIHQPNYNIFERWIESGLKETLAKECIGGIAYSPLAQGLLTDRYLHGIPEDSRAERAELPSLSTERVEDTLVRVEQLNEIAKKRHQTLAQMAIAWILRDGIMNSVLVGASRISQLADNLKALENLSFTDAELAEIDRISQEKL